MTYMEPAGAVIAHPSSSAPCSRSEEHTSELQSRPHLVCRLLLGQHHTGAGGPVEAGVLEVVPRLADLDLGVALGEFVDDRDHVLLVFFNDTATTEIYTLSLHDALPIWEQGVHRVVVGADQVVHPLALLAPRSEEHTSELQSRPHLVCRLLLEQNTRRERTGGLGPPSVEEEDGGRAAGAD